MVVNVNGDMRIPWIRLEHDEQATKTSCGARSFPRSELHNNDKAKLAAVRLE